MRLVTLRSKELSKNRTDFGRRWMNRVAICNSLLKIRT